MHTLPTAVPICVLTAAILCPLICAAQSTPRAAHDLALRDGAWAIQFQMPARGQNEGMTFSVKHHIREHTAIQLGMIYAPDELNRDDMQPHRSYGIRAVMQRYTEANPVRGYVGFGPIAARYHGVDRLSRYPTWIRTRTDWFAGAHAVAGAEWLLHRGVGILGEFQLRGYREVWHVTDRSPASTFIQTGRETSWRWSTIEFLGIAVYF